MSDLSASRLIISQCFAPQQGGIETLMLGLARALCDAKQQTTVYADGGRAEVQYDIKAAEQFVTKRIGGWKPWRRRRKARLAIKLIESSDFYMNEAANAVFYDSWKSLEFMPKCVPPLRMAVFAHGSEFPLHPTAAKQKRISASINKAQTIYAVSQAAAARALACGAIESKVQITPPPLPVIASPTKADLESAEKLWGNDTPRILTIARLSPRKGVDRTISAVAALSAAYPTMKYIVAGDGVQRHELQELAKQNNANVEFAGAVDDKLKAALYATADVFVLPARAEKNDMEGFGIVYLEAAWFGLPLLGGNSGGAREAVQDGKTGVLCDGNNVESVRDSLAALLADTQWRQQLGAAAKAHAQTQTWEKRIGDFL